jgi:ABC-2 type transport system permease protein
LGVPAKNLAFGKVLGLTSVLALLLIPAVFIGAAALMLNGSGANEWFGAWRFALLVVGYLLYLGIFLTVALAVSALAASTRVALLALLGFWIFSCLIAPRAATDIARRNYPTPSAFEFAKAMETDIRNGTDGHNASDKRLADLKIEIMRQYGVSRLEDLPFNFDGIALQAGEDFSNQVFDEHYGNLWNQFERQDAARRFFAVFAPQLAVGSLSRGLGGNRFRAASLLCRRRRKSPPIADSHNQRRCDEKRPLRRHEL